MTNRSSGCRVVSCSDVPKFPVPVDEPSLSPTSVTLPGQGVLATQEPHFGNKRIAAGVTTNNILTGCLEGLSRISLTPTHETSAVVKTRQVYPTDRSAVKFFVAGRNTLSERTLTFTSGEYAKRPRPDASVAIKSRSLQHCDPRVVLSNSSLSLAWSLVARQEGLTNVPLVSCAQHDI